MIVAPPGLPKRLRACDLVYGSRTSKNGIARLDDVYDTLIKRPSGYMSEGPFRWGAKFNDTDRTSIHTQDESR